MTAQVSLTALWNSDRGHAVLDDTGEVGVVRGRSGEPSSVSRRPHAVPKSPVETTTEWFLVCDRLRDADRGHGRPKTPGHLRLAGGRLSVSSHTGKTTTSTPLSQLLFWRERVAQEGVGPLFWTSPPSHLSQSERGSSQRGLSWRPEAGTPSGPRKEVVDGGRCEDGAGGKEIGPGGESEVGDQGRPEGRHGRHGDPPDLQRVQGGRWVGRRVVLPRYPGSSTRSRPALSALRQVRGPMGLGRAFRSVVSRRPGEPLRSRSEVAVTARGGGGSLGVTSPRDGHKGHTFRRSASRLDRAVTSWSHDVGTHLNNVGGHLTPRLYVRGGRCVWASPAEKTYRLERVFTTPDKTNKKKGT